MYHFSKLSSFILKLLSKDTFIYILFLISGLIITFTFIIGPLSIRRQYLYDRSLCMQTNVFIPLLYNLTFQFSPDNQTLIGNLKLKLKMIQPSRCLYFEMKNVEIQEIDNRNINIKKDLNQVLLYQKYRFPLGNLELNIKFKCKYTQIEDEGFFVSDQNIIINDALETVFPFLNNRTSFIVNVLNQDNTLKLSNMKLANITRFQASPIINLRELTLFIGNLDGFKFNVNQIEVGIYSKNVNNILYLKQIIENILLILCNYFNSSFEKVDIVLFGFKKSYSKSVGIVLINEDEMNIEELLYKSMIYQFVYNDTIEYYKMDGYIQYIYNNLNPNQNLTYYQNTYLKLLDFDSKPSIKSLSNHSDLIRGKGILLYENKMNQNQVMNQPGYPLIYFENVKGQYIMKQTRYYSYFSLNYINHKWTNLTFSVLFSNLTLGKLQFKENEIIQIDQILKLNLNNEIYCRILYPSNLYINIFSNFEKLNLIDQLNIINDLFSFVRSSHLQINYLFQFLNGLSSNLPIECYKMIFKELFYLFKFLEDSVVSFTFQSYLLNFSNKFTGIEYIMEWNYYYGNYSQNINSTSMLILLGNETYYFNSLNSFKLTNNIDDLLALSYTKYRNLILYSLEYSLTLPLPLAKNFIFKIIENNEQITWDWFRINYIRILNIFGMNNIQDILLQLSKYFHKTIHLLEMKSFLMEKSINFNIVIDFIQSNIYFIQQNIDDIIKQLNS